MLKEVVIDGWLKDDLEGSLDQVIENLQKLKEEHSKVFTDLRIRMEFYENGDYDMELLGKREETSEETNKRLFKESETLRIQKENDLRQLEILKKKYE
jgi:hypothetical protein